MDKEQKYIVCEKELFELLGHCSGCGAVVTVQKLKEEGTFLQVAQVHRI